ncbi:ribonuclease HII [Alkalicoccobacillus murimartini]|uniref:Ribonuclease HII n=1 Tax=Alkalicoccobacillus murimartini TaxID=171685 RepID=A0ABT9YF65_9BACI|nr:ribonuclease HII [Alkalicoccobacillus murimartini]MDQ0206364.1 ribonuclease HII [Alkalicoccobacillus murimartini]
MQNQSIREIKQQLASASTSEARSYIQQLEEDPRKGVQSLLKQYKREQEKKDELLAMFERMQEYEREITNQGFQCIAGLDEAGRGPLAGPVVAAAVILPADTTLVGLTDSKKLSKKKREFYFDEIKRQAIAYSIQEVDVELIDEINIYQATKRAMQLAVSDLSVQADYLLLDAMNLPIEVEQTSLIKGDQKSLSIAAASVLAKVWRDRLMEKLDQEYPQYGFATHAGYGTASHLQALKNYGVTPAHRRTFQPVKDYIS